MTSRRRFLRGGARAGIAAATYAAFPPSIQRALAIPANNATGTIRDVEHVVILMQENRAFDHYFGTLPGVRGFGDRFPIPLPEGRTVWQQRLANGTVVMPFHLDGSRGNAQRANGTPHDWNDSQLAWDNGRMDQWPRYKNPISMGYFNENEIPFQFALANAFTLCDAYHCAMHTGTDANRSFFITGTNGAVPTGTAFVSNEWDAIDGLPGGVDTGYTWTTYAERLEAAGVRWISYQNMPDEWGDNMLGAFRQFRRANIKSGYPVSSGGAPGQPYTDTGQAVPYHAYDAATDNPNNPLYKGIANTLPGTKPEQYLDAFRRDIREGKLPQVAWLNAPSIYCEHPGPSSPVQGAWFIQEVLDALTANPEVWSKTVLIVTYDENDGYFDHVPSPSAPSPDGKGGYAGKTTLSQADLAPEYYTHGRPAGSTKQPPADGRVYGPGPRVPLFVISPWSRGGWVNSQVFDHTSVLRFLEARFGVKEPNIGAYRRAVCGDLTSAFNFATPNAEPLPVLRGRKSRADADALRAAQQRLAQIAPPATPQRPVQAAGTRPSRALPYELATTCEVQPGATLASTRVALSFLNTGRQAAVFHVYDRKDLAAVPRRYTVEPGKSLSDAWTPGLGGGAYDLWVLGPNGYHRHFTGSALRAVAAGQPRPDVQVRCDAATGELVVRFVNGGAAPCTFNVNANAYAPLQQMHTVAPRGELSVRIPVVNNAYWYDFSVTVSGQPDYVRRFAGRVSRFFTYFNRNAMHPILRSFVLGAAFALCAPFASATVLTFDDIVGPDGFAAVPGNYGGLDWSGAGLSVFTGEQAPFTAHSGQGRVTTDWIDGGPAASTIRFLAPTVFDGAWFSGYADSSVRFDLYLGGQRVASSTTLQLSDVPAFLDAGWRSAVDTVVVSSGVQASYVMDDLTFGAATQVPEPGSLALVLAGVGLAGAVRRRRGGLRG